MRSVSDLTSTVKNGLIGISIWCHRGGVITVVW